jgi:hypothetical protein
VLPALPRQEHRRARHRRFRGVSEVKAINGCSPCTSTDYASAGPPVEGLSILGHGLVDVSDEEYDTILLANRHHLSDDTQVPSKCWIPELRMPTKGARTSSRHIDRPTDFRHRLLPGRQGQGRADHAGLSGPPQLAAHPSVGPQIRGPLDVTRRDANLWISYQPRH